MVDDISITLLNLRRRYNFSPTSPINRLNNDVLGIVFEYLRDPVKALSPEDVAAPIFDFLRREGLFFGSRSLRPSPSKV